MQGDFYRSLVFVWIPSAKESPDPRKGRGIGLNEVQWKVWSFYSLAKHWIYSMGSSFFLSSLSSHTSPLGLKDCPTPPVVLCHFTLAGFSRTVLSLVPPLLAQASWVLSCTLGRLGRAAVIPISIFWKRSQPLGAPGQPYQHAWPPASKACQFKKVKKRRSPALVQSASKEELKHTS